MPTGIVLSLTKFSDTGSIVHLYTAEQGRVQCAVYGNKYKGILRPLSIVEFTGSRRNNAPNQLTTLSNCQLSFVNSQLSTDIQRQCVAMFIAEVLNVQADSRYLNEETGKWNLDESLPLVYVHGGYYKLGEKLGHFGWSVKKK